MNLISCTQLCARWDCPAAALVHGGWRRSGERSRQATPLTRSAAPCRSNTTLPAVTASRGRNIGYGTGHSTMPACAAGAT